MIVLIAQVTGVTDIAAIISIFGVNAAMILFGWLQEKYETPGNGGVTIYKESVPTSLCHSLPNLHLLGKSLLIL